MKEDEDVRLEESQAIQSSNQAYPVKVVRFGKVYPALFR
jgi:hypothetical protein